MATPNGDRGQQWIHPVLGDLALWYPAFVTYAAKGDINGAHFQGSHVAATEATLDKVMQVLQDHRDELLDRPLPGLEKLRALLAGKSTVSDGGSMCHEIWHWINGGH